MLFSIQTFACSGLLENRIYIGVRVACVSKTTTATGFLDTSFASLRTTRKPRLNAPTSFMMFCLISIVIYGNANISELKSISHIELKNFC